jgi:hypothetical protein
MYPLYPLYPHTFMMIRILASVPSLISNFTATLKTKRGHWVQWVHRTQTHDFAGISMYPLQPMSPLHRSRTVGTGTLNRHLSMALDDQRASRHPHVSPQERGPSCGTSLTLFAPHCRGEIVGSEGASRFISPKVQVEEFLTLGGVDSGAVGIGRRST